MVSRNGMTWLAVVVLTIAAGFTAAPAAADPGPEHQVIPAPPDEAPETATAARGSSIPVTYAVYRVEDSGEGEVETELVRWHRGWGRHRWWGGRWGYGWGGGWGRGWGFPGWGWGRRWAFRPRFRPYYGGYFGYPAFGFGYGYPLYGNQFAYGYGGPYGYGGYGMSFGYPAYGFGYPGVYGF